MQKWQCRIAPSLGGGFAGHPKYVWGTTEYNNVNAPVVFFGLYGLNDFYYLWRHTGRKAILWAGSDITHFVNGYWLDDEGSIKLDPQALAEWINLNCENYVENWVEQRMLKRNGIKAKIVPSFLGDTEVYHLQPQLKKQQYYTSVSGDDFELYGWNEIADMATDYPSVEFHLYGAGKEWCEAIPNVFNHGRVSQEQMNKETSKMTGALRLTQFDGMSEILVKSILWGQWPVSPYIKYPHMDTEITKHEGQNTEGRNYYKQILNQYPWSNQHNNTPNTGRDAE